MASITDRKAEVKACVNTVEAGRRYTVLSSNGADWYTVIVNPSGKLACSCMAGQHGKRCRHADSVAGVLAADRHAADNWQAFADRVNSKALQQWPELAPRLAAEGAAAKAARRVQFTEGGTRYVSSVEDGEGWL